MADMLRDGMEDMAELLESDAATPAVYSRGPSLQCDLDVQIGESTFARESTEGLTTKKRSNDFLFRASLLILGGEAVEPEPGDRIEVEGYGTFVVVAPGGEEAAWRWSEHTHVRYRVHALEVLP